MANSTHSEELIRLQRTVTRCRLCPRLVKWREKAAQAKVPRYAGEEYWGKPVPGFGDPEASLLIVGLAPAAHGANRTGRMFTGDRSGEWLYRALHKYGFASQPASISRDDDLKLRGCYITAAARCAPPDNKPSPGEFANCRPFLLREYRLLPHVRIILGLGKLAFDAAYDSVKELNETIVTRRPKFSHGAEIELRDNLVLFGSYHPSQQNTFTGKLTVKMWEGVFKRVRERLKG